MWWYQSGRGDQRGALLESSNNVGVKFVMVPNGYMVPNGNTFRIFRQFLSVSHCSYAATAEAWEDRIKSATKVGYYGYILKTPHTFMRRSQMEMENEIGDGHRP